MFNKKLQRIFVERLKLFESDRSNSKLKDHELSGSMKGFRAFSITEDIRVIYQDEDRNTVKFYDVGSHNQVYK